MKLAETSDSTSTDPFLAEKIQFSSSEYNENPQNRKSADVDLQAGDHEAVLPIIAKVALASLRNIRGLGPCDMEDLAQEVVTTFWLQRSEIRSPKLWAAVCARNLGTRFVANSVQTEPISESTMKPKSCSRTSVERKILLSQIISKLSPDDRRCLVQYQMVGLTLAEMARCQDLSLRQAHRRLLTATRKASNLLKMNELQRIVKNKGKKFNHLTPYLMNAC